MVTLLFHKNNIVYCQDFSWKEGIPEGIRFEVKKFFDGKITLTAPNYGGKPYGNGCIYVYQKYLPKYMQMKIDFYSNELETESIL